MPENVGDIVRDACLENEMDGVDGYEIGLFNSVASSPSYKTGSESCSRMVVDVEEANSESSRGFLFWRSCVALVPFGAMSLTA